MIFWHRYPLFLKVKKIFLQKTKSEPAHLRRLVPFFCLSDHYFTVTLTSFQTPFPACT